MSRSILTKHYTRILTHWPPDLLRPTVSLPATLTHRIARLAPPPSTSTSTQAPATPTPAPAFDEAAELEQINVLYSFLEDRYAKRYPLSARMLRPASKPDYYDGLLKELKEAPGRSWFGSVVKRWKGALRFS